MAKYRRLYPHYSASDVFFSATTAARSWKSLIIESERRAEQGGAPTYVFQLNWPSPVDGGKWRSTHTLDIPLVFDNVAYAPTMVGTTPAAQRMADLMSEAWIAFARTGNPSTPNLPPWKPFTKEKRSTMIFDLKPELVDDPRGEERTFFASAVYVQPGT